MSQPKRYWIDDHSAIEDSNGKWVLHSDYAALAAENKRLNDIVNHYYHIPNADTVSYASWSKLTAENERLRKAGDEMADTLNSTYTKEVKEMNLRQWAAAKEGRDAK